MLLVLKYHIYRAHPSVVSSFTSIRTLTYYLSLIATTVDKNYVIMSASKPND